MTTWFRYPGMAPALALSTGLLLAVLGGCGGASDTGGGSGLSLPSGADRVFAVIGDYGDTSDIDDGDTDTLAVADLIKSWNPAAILTVGDNDYSDLAYATGTLLGAAQIEWEPVVPAIP